MNEPLRAEAPQLHQEIPRIWTRDFILVCSANFFIFLGFQMTLPTLPLFVEQLGGNDQLIGFVVGIFTFSALLVRPYAGRLLETKGRGFVYLSGLAVFVLSVGSYGWAGSMVLLFFMRVVQGVGWGFSTTASGTIATDMIPPQRRGEGMGYYGLFGNIALALGPSLGLALAGALPFTQLFLICALCGLAALALSARIRYQKSEEKAKQTGRVKWDVYEKSALEPSILLFFMTVTFGGNRLLPAAVYGAERNCRNSMVFSAVCAGAYADTHLRREMV